MEPAYQIPLTEKLAELGALAVLLGQVDEILIRTVERLLNLNRQSANRIMGSSKVAENSHLGRGDPNRTTDEDVLWLVEHAGKWAVSAGRNDHPCGLKPSDQVSSQKIFFASLFWPGYFGGRRVVTARRVRNESSGR